MKLKDKLIMLVVLFLCGQWIFIKFSIGHLATPWSAIAPGLAIFGAAFMLSWAAELAQFEIPQALATAFLALIAVLPEYAVDAYFAWKAAQDPVYIHYATANMTGANRLLIGMGWATVVFAYFFKTGKKKVMLEASNRVELFALLIATAYCFVIPIKGTLSYIDSVFLLSIFIWYIIQSARAEHHEPDVEGFIEYFARWPRFPRLLITLIFFAVSGFTIFIAAEPFAEGLLVVGRHWGIEEFILVQWLAPLASEAPEFIVAIIFALHCKPTAALSTLVSSKVNQWTLLVGMLPLIYAVSAGKLIPMQLDLRQSEEIFLTVSQSLFAVMVIANLQITLFEAILLFGLFVSQLFITSEYGRHLYSFVYLVLSIALLLVQKENRQGVLATLKIVRNRK